MSGRNVLLAVLSVGGSTANGGPAAAMLCSALAMDEERGRRSEVVGDRMLIVEGRRRERKARKAAVKKVLKNAIGWTRKAACLA